MAGPAVTVVVVTWNAADLLARCLAALESQTLDRAAYEMVVIDNASVDGTGELLARDFPDVRVLALDRNTGFAGGCSAALHNVDTPWVVLVNNDAVVEPDFLESLLAETHSPGASEVGAWTARVLLAAPDSQGRTLVNSTGVVVRQDGNGADRGWLTPADGPRPSPDVFRFCNEHNRLITLAKKAPLHPMATVALRHPMMSAVRLAGGTTQRRIARVRLRAYADFLRRLPEVSRQRRSMPSPMRARRREVAKLLVSGRARPS